MMRKKRASTASRPAERPAAAIGPAFNTHADSQQAAAAAAHLMQPWAPSPITYVFSDLLPDDTSSLRASTLPWSGRHGSHARYKVQQELTVFINDGWHDARVTAPPGPRKISHTLELSAGKKVEHVFLSPWNHAPRDVKSAAFAAHRKSYTASLAAEHSTVLDAVSGSRLDLGIVPVSVVSAAAAPPPYAIEHWTDVSKLGRWLFRATFIRSKLAHFIGRLLDLTASYVAETGSKPSDTAAWLSAELKACQSLLLEILPEPWHSESSTAYQTLLDQLSGLGKSFHQALDDLDRRHQELRRALEDSQRRDVQNRINQEREAKMAFEIEQKEHREDRDSKLKEAVLEVAADKREEHLRIGRDEIAAESRNASEAFTKRLEQAEQQFVAEQKGQRMTVEISQHKERYDLLTSQQNEPFVLLESKLMSVLEDMVNAPTSLLLTADPAAGKTSLVLQLLSHVLQEAPDVVPILIKVHEWQLLLERHAALLSSSECMNWVDLALQLEHGVDSELYRALRQAMRCRRALLLIDGLDEGGSKCAQIEDHIVQVLAVQGHTMIVTSRPDGVHLERFKTLFHLIKLGPLTTAQQEHVIQHRLGIEASSSDGGRWTAGSSDGERLLQYVRESVPRHPASGLQITSNPLVLSILISTFEMRQKAGLALQLPASLVDLYEMATRMMLDRVSKGFGARSLEKATKGGASPEASKTALVLSPLAICQKVLASQKRVNKPSEWSCCKLGEHGKRCGHPCTHRLEHLPESIHEPVKEAFAKQKYGKMWVELSPTARDKLQGKWLCPNSTSCLHCLDGLLRDAGFGRYEGQSLRTCVCPLCVAWRGEQKRELWMRTRKEENHLALLLRGAFLEAHLGQQRKLEREHVATAAIRLHDPRQLAAIRERTSMPVSQHPPKDGEWVQVVKGDFAWQYGHCFSYEVSATSPRLQGKHEANGSGSAKADDKESAVRLTRYAVRFANQRVDAGLPAEYIVASGMIEAECRAWSHEHRTPALIAAATSLAPDRQRDIQAVLEADATIADLLRADPPHALQEYLAAREICDGVRLFDHPPWLWTHWWANTLAIGIQIGDPFRRGLLRAAGVHGYVLNLRGKLGGDRAVSLRAVGQLLQVVTSADLSQNGLGSSGAAALAEDIAQSRTLDSINLGENQIGSEGVKQIAEAVVRSASLTMVDLRATTLPEEDQARLRRVASHRRAIAGERRLNIFTDYADEPGTAISPRAFWKKSSARSRMLSSPAPSTTPFSPSQLTQIVDMTQFV